jgi:hypothetical protein
MGNSKLGSQNCSSLNCHSRLFLCITRTLATFVSCLFSGFIAVSCTSAPRSAMILNNGAVIAHRWMASRPVYGYIWTCGNNTRKEYVDMPSSHIEIVQVSDKARIRFFIKIGESDALEESVPGVEGPSNPVATTYASVDRALDLDIWPYLIMVERTVRGKAVLEVEMRLLLTHPCENGGENSVRNYR